MSKAFVSVDNLSKVFPAKDGDLTVFENVNIDIEKGEFVCIIGHSGCGKSTILNVLAGLDQPSTGNIIMDGKEVSGPSLDRGVVFQNYSLLPWLTALQNVCFGVRARWPKWSREQVREHGSKYLSMVGLGHSLHKKPSELSGGMRQRVSIARAFATSPKLLLLDEPFGALDALTRGVIQDELIKIWSETRQTVFMITHDVDEAILLADRILLMTTPPRARPDYRTPCLLQDSQPSGELPGETLRRAGQNRWRRPDGNRESGYAIGGRTIGHLIITF